MTNNEEWFYIIDKNDCVFQSFGNELIDAKSHVAVLEYIFNLKNKYDHFALKKRNGVEYYRAGISYNVEELKALGLGKYIQFFEKLNREVTCISEKDISRIITPTQSLNDIMADRIPTNPYVKRDLTYLLSLIKQNFSSEVAEHLGIEGSLCFGISDKFSDIDVIVNGQEPFEQLNSDWKNIVNAEKKISLLNDVPICQDDLLADRKRFIPCQDNEILFHEKRKNYAYISKDGLYRKINIVGKLNKEDPLYKERSNKYFANYSFKPLGLCKIKGVTKTDELGDYIPSIYDTDTLNFQTLSKDKPEPVQPVNVEYIIDYVGSYYMQLKKGEVFESVGMLEEIYKNNVPSGKYRVSLNHWDGHVEKGMYLKTIANNYNDYIKEIDVQSKDLKDFINLGTLNLLNKGR